MAEFIHPYDLPEGDEQRNLHLNRYIWASTQIRGPVVANAACSTNYGTPLLEVPGRLVVGFDRNEVALERARKEGRYKFFNRDIQLETFEGFTSLVCLETFEHLVDPWDFLSKLSLSVKEIAMSVPCIPTKHFNEFHLTDFTEESFKEGVTAQGWQIVSQAYQDETGLAKPTYILIYAIRK